MGSLLLVFALCISFVFAVQHSERAYDAFSPRVHYTRHVADVTTPGLNYLPYFTSLNGDADSHMVALDLAEQIIGFPVTYNVKNSYVNNHNQIRHVYLKQTAEDGREIFNADLNINVLNRKATSAGHTFYSGSTSALTGHITSIDAVNVLAAFLKIDTDGWVPQMVSAPTGIEKKHQVKGLKGAVSPANVRAGYVQVGLGTKLEPVWDIELDMNVHWWNAHVSMRTGEVLSVFDWVNDLNEFDIYPISVNDPSDGSRVIVKNPATEPASPLGWNDQGNGPFTNTIGNNVYAQSNPSGGSSWQNNPRPEGGPNHDFIFPIDFTQQPVTYVNASSTNLFAWNNYIHDIFYQYGFNESAGNFQENNLGRGGLENDAVQANCQDGAGFNNANMATPVDGQRPRMRMYVWNRSNPWRDGDLDNGIIIHEYAHGITNRMTGGPMNANCLSGGEPGGMGEGWGDFFANLIRQRESYKREMLFPMGAYSANISAGIRKYPYTTDMKIDPETYGYINLGEYAGVHAKGEVWCGILWETYWNFRDELGFSSDLFIGEAGNNMIFRNVVNALAIQPCNPNFVDARNAILEADKANYNSANFCRLWRGFAKRGLGVNAVGGTPSSPTVKEDFTLPAGC